MEVEVGKYYLDGNGVVRYIDGLGPDLSWHYMSIEGKTYTKSGIYTTDLSDSKHNLVKELTKDEYPEYFL